MAKMSVLEKILKNKNHDMGELISKSTYFKEMEMCPTAVPMINLALSGQLDGGLSDGMTVLAGPSRHFKSMFGLLMVKAFLDKYADGAVIFYDSEKGMTGGYFDSLGIDTSRVVHVPIMTVEDLKNKMASILNETERGENLMFFIDSLGNLPSAKEVNDAIDQKEVADMTRAKAIKSFTRVVSGPLKFKNLPAVVIAHTYKTQEMFAKDVVNGGTGVVYVPDNIWILGRRKEKDKESGETLGFEFVIRVEKSRYVKEGSEIPIRVSFEHGIHTYSGLSDIAHAQGIIDVCKVGRKKGYSFTPKSGKPLEVAEDVIDQSKEFWDLVFKETEFTKYLNQAFTLTKSGKLI